MGESAGELNPCPYFESTAAIIHSPSDNIASEA